MDMTPLNCCSVRCGVRTLVLDAPKTMSGTSCWLPEQGGGGGSWQSQKKHKTPQALLYEYGLLICVQILRPIRAPLALAAPPPTCPPDEALSIGGGRLLQARENGCFQEAAKDAGDDKSQIYSEQTTKSVEDRLLLLQQTVDELRKRLDAEVLLHQLPQTRPVVHSSAAGDARDLLFAVRQMQFSRGVSFVELVSLTRKRDESFSLALSSVLLVTCSKDGFLEVRSVADPSNFVGLQTKHAAQVLSLSVFPRGEDLTVLTTDADGVALLHLLVASRGEASAFTSASVKLERPATKRLAASPLALSLEAADSFRVTQGGAAKKHNCVISATLKGERVLVVGGGDGSLSVYARSGSLKARVIVTNEEGGIQHLAHLGGFTIFATKRCVGHVNPLAVELSGKMSCVGMAAPIASIALDARKHGRGAVALQDGQILYMDVKSWTLLHKFPSIFKGPMKLYFSKDKLLAATLADAGGSSASKFLSVFFAFPQSGIALFDLNAAERPESSRGPPVYVLPLKEKVRCLREAEGDAFLFSIQRLMFAFHGNSVQIFECLHHDQPALSDESWSHIRLPIMLITILVAVGAQVYRTRRSSKSREEQPAEDPASAAELDALWKERLRLQSERSAFLSEYRSFNDQSLCSNGAAEELSN
ncbi:hypothetical protein Efla_006144 [Eimeria flavescens]